MAQETTTVMIDGDRLLQALYVLQALDYMVRAGPHVSPDHPLSHEKLAGLQERFSGLTDRILAERMYRGSRDDIGLGPLHALLMFTRDARAAAFPVVKIAEIFLTGLWRREHLSPFGADFRKFFSAFASGELSETDFR